MRPLTLHASALTDSEYTLYTTSLCDLAGEDDEAHSHSHDDSYYSALQISVREARGWVCGRYTDLSPANVDAVLKLFCPNLNIADILSGGQFFAVLRLVTHLRHGHPLDGNLVFVQAHPDDTGVNAVSGSTSDIVYHGRRTTTPSDSTVPAKRARSGGKPGSVSTSDIWNHEKDGWHMLHDDNKWKQFADYWSKQDFEMTLNSSSIPLAYDDSGKDDPKHRLPLSPNTNNEIIIRDCYKVLYNFISKAKQEEVIDGLILTGQPGTGKTMWLSYMLACFISKHEAVAYHCSAGTFLFFGKSVYSRISTHQYPEFPSVGCATCCLIDLDMEHDPVTINFMTQNNPETFPVLASSPNPIRYNGWRKDRSHVMMDLMPLWSRDELWKGLPMQKYYSGFCERVQAVLHPPAVDVDVTMDISPPPGETGQGRGEQFVMEHRKQQEDQILSALQMVRDERDDANYDATVDDVMGQILDSAMEKYGSSARDVYTAIRYPTYAEGRVVDAVRRLTYKTLLAAVVKSQNLDYSGIDDGVTPHDIFSINPTGTIGRERGSERSLYEIEFKSPWIRSIVSKKLSFLQHIQNASIIAEMQSVTYAASFADWLYEGFAAKVLASGEALSLSLVRMRQDGMRFSVPIVPEPDETISSPFSRQRKLFPARFLIGDGLDISVAPPDKLDNYFWMPEAANNPLFDAFFIEFKQDSAGMTDAAIVWILQMTLCEKHCGSSKGYKRIEVIRAKAREAIKAMARAVPRMDAIEAEPVVEVKYVLVSPTAGQWELPRESWARSRGEVYYQCLKADPYDTLPT